MWPGPYGQGGGSRKYVLASPDESLQRMGVDYVDIFYSHRFDVDTPLEETASALATAVQHGKALYVGISSYSAGRDGRDGKVAKGMGASLPDPSTFVRTCSTAGSRGGRSTHWKRKALAASPSPLSLKGS